MMATKKGCWVIVLATGLLCSAAYADDGIDDADDTAAEAVMPAKTTAKTTAANTVPVPPNCSDPSNPDRAGCPAELQFQLLGSPPPGPVHRN